MGTEIKLHKAEKAQRTKEYKDMALFFDVRCWACRGTSKPDWFNAVWGLHRAHIVNKPRLEDRRVVILLCPVCHMIQEGETLPEAGDQPALTVADMLYLKKKYDPGYYDTKLIGECTVKKLPRPKLQAWYQDRQGDVTETGPTRVGNGSSGIEFLSTHAVIDPSLEWDGFCRAVAAQEAVTFSHQWWIGDLINFGEDHYEEDVTQAINVTGNRLETLQLYSQIARRIPADSRREGLSFTAHRQVAYLDPDDRNLALDYAEEHDLGSRELKQAVARFNKTGSFDKPEPVEAEVLVEATGDVIDQGGVEVPDDDVVERARGRVPGLVKSLRLQLDNLGADGRFDETLDQIEEFAR